MRDAREVDGGDFAEALPEVADARLHELLAGERGVVLGVLPEVAELFGALDLARQVDAQLGLQLVQFALELLLDAFGHFLFPSLLRALSDSAPVRNVMKMQCAAQRAPVYTSTGVSLRVKVKFRLPNAVLSASLTRLEPDAISARFILFSLAECALLLKV